ncbi:nucleotidyltransferase family protein [Mycolicibacterium sp. 018/SC-01/001]|uniref:nucleotidyltransferase family protein n=1 Tax=Mycolicibacterium sp. 018/SC-01/001 TaxID=2592069 RepID=UPI00117E1F1A|nr:nucleotidyltransferase family protein [Mycolicibacterium sp. 018/SC-01/001]TRW81524.1 nucleotidyltransferase family protein [Mycolicibacterium sp. 018/SC-01/001]
MSPDDLREALRRAASALKAEGPPFALAGSFALWVYGAPEPSHDVDFVVAESDVEAAAAALTKAGFDIRRPPEDWLFKAALSVDGPALVDVLHQINRVPVDPQMIAEAPTMDVLALSMPVLTPAEVILQKLRSLHEHHCDFAKLLPVVRGVREQLDWAALRTQTADNPFAATFLDLCARLGIDAERTANSQPAIS